MKTALKTLLALGAGIVAVTLGATLAGVLSIGSLFTSETVVQDHAAVLESLEEIADLHAATGEFQVVIDVEERTRFVPGFLKGERTSFLAQGAVDAVVDLDGLDEDSVIVAEDGSVTVLLPPAQLADPVVDHDASGVLDRDRGIVDRVAGFFEDEPTSDKRLYLEAERRLAEAAADSDLRTTGEANAAATVEALLRDAGVADVQVVFAAPADVS